MTLHRLGVINVPVKVGARSWAKCWTVMANHTSVFGINESLSRRQRAVYAARCLRRGWGQYGLRNSPNPIFWDRDVWTKVKGSGRIVKLHGPGPWAHSWPGYNGSRYATVIVLQRRSGQQHAIINTHLVPNGHKVPAVWREQVRGDSFKQLAELVDDLTTFGLVVWLLGDMNVTTPFDMGDRFRWIRGKGIDKLGVSLPDHIRITDAGFELIALPEHVTDHKHGLTARVHLEKEKP